MRRTIQPKGMLTHILKVMRGPGESHILQRIAQGDPHAMWELLARYGDLVWSLARRSCAGEAEAEDAVQEIFIHLWQRAAMFDPSIGEEVTFVSVLARRKLMDRARRAGRAPRQVDVEEARRSLSLPDSAPGEEARHARAALDSLDAEQRGVLILSIAHGFSHEAIAGQTGLPLGTVKSHIRRGLAHVRERLDALRGVEVAR